MKLLMKIITFALTGILYCFPGTITAGRPSKTIHWNWNIIDVHQLTFPDKFLWGSATSALQVEGTCTNTDWNLWEQSFDEFGKPRVESKVGIAVDHWNRYKEDIAIMAELGLTCYRFSVDWGKIEPEPGLYNTAALDHYEDVCKTLVAYGIKPVITLHHFTCPTWFAKKGGFENDANIPHFVAFCKEVFQRLHSYVHLWITFNSPTSLAMKGYWQGAYPPALKDINVAARVLANILEAHVQVYTAVKALPGGTQSNVGILHNIFQIQAWHGKHFIKRALEKRAIKYYNHLARNPVYAFFTTGVFESHGIKHVNKNAPKTLDFIGLNYYSRAFMKEKWFSFKVASHPHEIAADHDKYTLYAEGFHAAIKEISERVAKPLHIPIYITENGIATENEATRKLFFERYIYALSRSIEDGHDVRGYMTWSFIDNYSWGTYRKKYGLIGVEPTTLNRTALKSGAKHFIYVANSWGAHTLQSEKYNRAWLEAPTDSSFYSWVV